MSSRWFSFLDRRQSPEGQDEAAGDETGEEGQDAGSGAPPDIVRHLPLELIDTNPYQPRQMFADDNLQELAESIARYGVLQPVVVRADGDRYELIVGERRLRASRLAGLETIPAVVRVAGQEEVALLALVENLQRQDLGFFEEAVAYARLLEEFGLTQAALAENVGKSQSTIANKLRLLRLPEDVKTAVEEAGLSERHARALLQLESADEQLAVVEQVTDKQLSVRQTDELVKRQSDASRDQSRAQRFVKIYKDLRIFLNSFRELVRNLREAGFDAKLEQEQTEDEIVVRIRIVRPEVPRQNS